MKYRRCIRCRELRPGYQQDCPTCERRDRAEYEAQEANRRDPLEYLRRASRGKGES